MRATEERKHVVLAQGLDGDVLDQHQRLAALEAFEATFFADLERGHSDDIVLKAVVHALGQHGREADGCLAGSTHHRVDVRVFGHLAHQLDPLGWGHLVQEGIATKLGGGPGGVEAGDR